MFRMIKTLLAITLIFLISVSSFNEYVNNGHEEIKHELKYALKTACYDATNIMRDGSTIKGINDNLSGLVSVDKEKALNRFMSTIETNMSHNIKYSLPVRGVITNDGLQICKYDGTWFIKIRYSYFAKKNNSIYTFTLDDELMVHNLDTGINTHTKLSNVPSPYKNMTMKQLKEFTIMATINEEISKVLSSEDNIAAVNLKTGLEVKLETFDQVTYGADTYYNDFGNIIRDIGFFAVIDGHLRGMEGVYVRLARISGSELRQIK